jgi:beta-galactosidase
MKLMTANWLLSLAALAAVSNVGGLPALRQSGKGHQDAILFGAAYYEEYGPYDLLDEDVRMMKATGITVVRIVESTWE